MNDIPATQNEPDNIKILAAQRQLYTKAKRTNGLQIILSVPCVIALSVLIIFKPELKVWAAFWGIFVALLDLLVLQPREKALKKEAAKLQEYFDSRILGISWNKFRLGNKHIARPAPG